MTTSDWDEKKYDSIKIGGKYNIVGPLGGCLGYKCNTCRHFPSGIIVTGKNGLGINDGRTIRGISTISKDTCIFDHRDLKSMIPNWRKRLGGIKK